MSVLKYLFGFTFFVVSILGTSHKYLDAQVTIEKEETDSEFMVSTAVKLGFSGFETTYWFSRIDKNGFQYDVLSLLGAGVNHEGIGIGSELGLTEEQSKEINLLRSDTMAELSELVGEAIIAGKDKLEAKFQEAEDEVRSMLNEEQLGQLEQIKTRRGIAQVGLAKYFSSQHVENPISSEQAKQLEDVTKVFRANVKEGTEKLLKQANKKLLAQLSQTQQDKFESGFNEKHREKFLSTEMYNWSYHSEKKLAKRNTDLYRILKLKSVRTKIGLGEDQYSEIKVLDREQRKSVGEKLTSEQTQKLNQKVVESDLNRMGTVHALCGGYLRQVVSIDDAQAKELHTAGKEIYEELNLQLREMKKEAFRESISGLSDSFQEKLLEMVGEGAIAGLPE